MRNFLLRERARRGVRMIEIVVLWLSSGWAWCISCSSVWHSKWELIRNCSIGHSVKVNLWSWVWDHCANCSVGMNVLSMPSILPSFRFSFRPSLQIIALHRHNGSNNSNVASRISHITEYVCDKSNEIATKHEYVCLMLWWKLKIKDREPYNMQSWPFSRSRNWWSVMFMANDHSHAIEGHDHNGEGRQYTTGGFLDVSVVNFVNYVRMIDRQIKWPLVIN